MKRPTAGSVPASGIVRKPGVMGGSPTISGTRVRVADIVRHKRRLGSEAAILQALPHLTPANIKAALRFYEQNQAEIDSYIEQEDRLAPA